MTARNYVPGTQIEVVRNFSRRQFKRVLFDFDGTISLLRKGWQHIMAPVCIEMICGDHAPTPAIVGEVWEMIAETTGVQTILQMERLTEMVRMHGLVPEARILDAQGYKEVYNARLMEPVNERIARLDAGECTPEDFMVRGVRDFLRRLAERGIEMDIFSGTDQADVRNEADKLGVAEYFNQIWGALRTVAEYSKEQVVGELIARHGLRGPELLAIGDGPVEIRSVKLHGGMGLGVASNESTCFGWDEEKRRRLLDAEADLLVSDFGEAGPLLDCLFGER